jgi:hypothetical protein
VIVRHRSVTLNHAESPAQLFAIRDGVRVEMTTITDQNPTPRALSRRDPIGRFEASSRLPRYSRFTKA